MVGAKHPSGSAADHELDLLEEFVSNAGGNRIRRYKALAALVGVREQLRQAEQELGARQKPREEGESDGLDVSLARRLSLMEVSAERDRQDAKWGGPEHDDELTNGNWTIWISLLDEHAHKAYSGDNSPDAYRNARSRFIEVAALAVAAVESLDREVGEEMHPPNTSRPSLSAPSGGSAASKELALELVALRVERDAAVEALREIAAMYVRHQVEPTTRNGVWIVSNGSLANAADRAREALAAGSYTEGGTQAQTDLGGGKAAERG